MVRVADLLISFLIMAGARADRALDCAALCGSKMTLECCECIGCHQGMRFGKRSAPFYPEDRFEDDDGDVTIARVLPRLSHYLDTLVLDLQSSPPRGRRVFRLKRRYFPF